MKTISDFLTWENLKTFSGCVALVGTIVQFTKNSLDKYIKMPTKRYTYFVSLVVLIILDILFGPWNFTNFLLDFADAIIVSMSANEIYDLFSDNKVSKNEKV